MAGNHCNLAGPHLTAQQCTSSGTLRGAHPALQLLAPCPCPYRVTPLLHRVQTILVPCLYRAWLQQDAHRQQHSPLRSKRPVTPAALGHGLHCEPG